MPKKTQSQKELQKQASINSASGLHFSVNFYKWAVADFSRIPFSEQASGNDQCPRVKIFYNSV
jgi:hypothetical protein